MKIATLMFVIALCLNVLYLVMAFYVFLHVDETEKTKQSVWLLAGTMWWPLYDIYDDFGQRMRLPSLLVLIAGASAYAAWAALD